MFRRISHICNAGCCLLTAAFVPPNCSGTASSQKTELAAQGETMVREQIAGRGITDSATLHAMRAVPRHEFLPLRLRGEAYADYPLPIGHGQTISQPYIVAFMTEAIRP